MTNGNGYALHDSFKELDNIDYYKIKQEIIDSFVTTDPVSDRVCDFCGETFAYLNRLVAHLSTVHGIERPFKCPLCDKDYPHRFMLNAHARKHHGFSLVACAHCSYSTMDRTKLERHIRKLHNNELPVSVAAKNDSLEYISEEFSSYLEDFEDYTSSLEASISFPAADSPQPPAKRKRGRPRTGRTKRPNRTYLCTYCGKELKTIKGLQIHTRLHTGEKPFTCPYCEKRFSCETLLRTHRVTHTGERPYRCDLCGKTFTQRSTLVVHKRYHSGERPYVCERCSKGFVTRTLLNSHLKSCF